MNLLCGLLESNVLDKYTFVDKSDQCFQYELDEIECPSDSSKYTSVKVAY